MPIFVILLLVIVVMLYWMATHNKLISLKNQIRQTFSGIDIQLKRRWDLIPQLVAVTEGYAKHEADLFEVISEVRTAAQAAHDARQRFINERIISEKAPQIIALAEGYPELKASEQFLMLQRNLTEVESQISASRRSYNAAVLQYNNLIQSFPSSIIASNGDHQSADFFNIESAERHHVSLS